MIQNRSALLLGLGFVLGCVALSLILNIRLSGPSAGVHRIGRYQISGVPGHIFVLDTGTGRVWEKCPREESRVRDFVDILVLRETAQSVL